MRRRTEPSRLVLIVLALVASVAAASEPLELARGARYADLAALGAEALPPLLGAYPTADRETRTAILFALGAMNIKSPAAKGVLGLDVGGEDSFFQDLHRYALAAVDPTVRSRDLYEQVTAEGVPLEPELGRFMYATLSVAYDACGDRVVHARRWVAGLAAADPEARYAAIVSLRILTGASHAYHPWASEPDRHESLRAWRRWLRRLEASCRG